MIVLDASLVVKILVFETDSEAARSWFRQTSDDILAPDLILVEVAQAIARRVNARDVTRDAARQTSRDWRAMLDERGIDLRPTDPEQVEIAAEIAMQIGHPTKDCVYLALAMEYDCELVTCDAKFAAKARAVHSAVRLLADYTAS